MKFLIVAVIGMLTQVQSIAIEAERARDVRDGAQKWFSSRPGFAEQEEQQLAERGRGDFAERGRDLAERGRDFAERGRDLAERNRE